MKSARDLLVDVAGDQAVGEQAAGGPMNDPDKGRCTRLTISKAYATHPL
ncbi:MULTISPECIES: hypothetical protein [Streptomyces]|nr:MULTISPECIES: hypothetical protein [unclassified Streptomyces]